MFLEVKERSDIHVPEGQGTTLTYMFLEAKAHVPRGQGRTLIYMFLEVKEGL